MNLAFGIQKPNRLNEAEDVSHDALPNHPNIGTAMNYLGLVFFKLN